MRLTLRVACGLAALLIFLGAPPLAGAQERQAMSFTDVLELPGIQDPQLSPDGRQVLFVLERADWAGNRRVGHVHRINIDGTVRDS